MGEWIYGAVINVFGSIGINFGTNLLKLGHNQRERLAVLEAAELGEKTVSKKPIVYFQSWQIGVLIFTVGNLLNFISFGYAAQSLLAALGSVQFVSNVGFAYFVLKEKVTARILVSTLVIVAGNIFLVAFGNHQSTIYTPEELLANYVNHVYLLYCACLIILVVVSHATYKRGRLLISTSGEQNVDSYWHTLLPFSYAVVSGTVGSHSVLFAKSLSILLRLTINGENQLEGWFTYVVLFLFLGTASFWMARLNDGLAMFDAILIIPMLQIVWTFFSIFTGFIYFAEYQVFDGFRTAMFAVGISTLFLGILLLAPETSRGPEQRMFDKPSEESSPLMEVSEGLPIPPVEQREPVRSRSFVQHVFKDAAAVVGKAKTACKMSLGLDQDRVPVTSVFAMPMIASSRMTWRSSAVANEWLSSLTIYGDQDLVVPSANMALGNS